jgi:CheY-like chemotaxis protein/HPt (histidine-containing phosphotransfer) domain-containing protein
MKTPGLVLVLEDDALIRRFITMALGELPIRICHAASIAEAFRLLQSQDVDLFISDLMLPDGNAMDLFRVLRGDARHLGLRIVILSAGVTAAVRALASDMDVFRVLEKPVSYVDLVACVEQAIDASGPVAAVSPVVATRISATQRERAIEEHFGGRSSLFDEFFTSCVAVLPGDIQAGDVACASRDAGALRRVAHNLKSVLQLMGSTQGHVMARQLEQAVAADEAFPALASRWGCLHAHVDSLCRAHAATAGVRVV